MFADYSESAGESIASDMVSNFASYMASHSSASSVEPDFSHYASMLEAYSSFVNDETLPSELQTFSSGDIEFMSSMFADYSESAGESIASDMVSNFAAYMAS